MSRRERASPRQQEEMHVPDPLVVARYVGALRSHDPLDGGDPGPENGAERRRLRRGEIRQRLAVATNLDDQLARVGMGAGVVGHEPEAVIVDGAAGSGDPAGDLVADAAG